MLKKLLPIALIASFSILNVNADDRYSLDLYGSYNTFDLSQNMSTSSGDVSSESSLGDITGFTVGASFIVNDGYLFGNSGYLHFYYEKDDGPSFLNSDSTIRVLQTKEQYGGYLTEDFISKKYRYYAGIGLEKTIWDLETTDGLISYDWMSIGLRAGGTKKITNLFDIGINVFGNYGILPKVTVESDPQQPKYTLGTVYDYGIEIPLTLKVNSAFELSFSTQYRKYNFQNSDSIGGTSFPDSDFDETKVMVGLRMIIR